MNSNTDDLKAFFYTDTVVKKDKSLKDISKLVFSDIAYFHFLREGKCRATNEYFAKKYGKSNGTISKAISELDNKGYIERYLDQYKNRTIYVRRSKFASGLKNEGISDGNNHPDNRLQSEEGSDQMENKSSLRSITGESKYIKLSKNEMEDLINKTFSNE
jgi:DNA-binding transcriptional regulator YhcF (GntR family)